MRYLAPTNSKQAVIDTVRLTAITLVVGKAEVIAFLPFFLNDKASKPPEWTLQSPDGIVDADRRVRVLILRPLKPP